MLVPMAELVPVPMPMPMHNYAYVCFVLCLCLCVRICLMPVSMTLLFVVAYAFLYDDRLRRLGVAFGGQGTSAKQKQINRITRRRTQLTIQTKATYRLTGFGRHSFAMPTSVRRGVTWPEKCKPRQSETLAQSPRRARSEK